MCELKIHWNNIEPIEVYEALIILCKEHTYSLEEDFNCKIKEIKNESLPGS